MDDPQELRRAAREGWEGAAAGWVAERGHFQGALQPVTDWLLDAAALAPGHTVLELAAGTGETGLAALGRIRPGGRLISTDGAEAMVEAARARGAELGVGEDEAEFRAMELEWVDRPAASVDAVICRFGLMLAVDPDAALLEMRRVLRPGGHLVLAVWDAAERNPWSPGRVFQSLGHVPPPGPDDPGPFRLGDPGALAERLLGAGLFDVRVETVEVWFRAPSLDELWERQSRLSPTAAKVLAGLSPAEVYAVRDALDAQWAPYVADDGSVAVPGRVLAAAAEA